MNPPAEYLLLPTSQLIENPTNRRVITKESYQLLLEKLQLKRQFKPLLITPTDTDVTPREYMVLAGNHRLKGYKELGIQTVWVSILDIIKQDDGLFHVYRDGIEEVERFQTKEDAILDWALTDNEEFAQNDWDQFVNDMSGYNLDWSRYKMSFGEQKTIKNQLNDFLMRDKDDEEKEQAAHMTITFQSNDDLSEARVDIEHILKNYRQATIKVSPRKL